jgi:hypothetical protein
LAKGEVAYFQGRWKEARLCCDQAEAIFRNRCTGVNWECHTALMYSLWSLFCMGEMAELVRRSAILRREARERGDHYAATTLGLGTGILVRMAADDADGARRELQQLVAQCSDQGYHVQEYSVLLGQVGVELFFGQGETAWQVLQKGWPRLVRSLLWRIQLIRIFMLHLRTRAALAAAQTAADPKPYLRTAEGDARSLQRERMPWSEALVPLVRGGVAAAQGDRAGAIRLLQEAERCLEKVDMHLLAQIARRRRGQLQGGPEGHELMAQADEWMKEQKIQNPARFTALFAPGFGDAPSA